LKVFDLDCGKLARNLVGHHTRVGSIQYHPFGEFVVSGADDCTMKVWDLRSKECMQTYHGHTKEITCVRFNPDGKWIASAAKDGQLRLWDLVAGKLITTIRLQQPVFANTFKFNPVEYSLAAATSMRTVKFWDLATMEPSGTTTSEANPIQSIAYSSHGKSLCIASKDTLKVWDVHNNSLSLRGGIDVSGWDNIQDVKLTDDLQLLAGSCMASFVSVWSVDIEKLLARQKEAAKEVSMDVTSDHFSSKRDAKSDSPGMPPSREVKLDDAQGEMSPLRSNHSSNMQSVKDNAEPVRDFNKQIGASQAGNWSSQTYADAKEDGRSGQDVKNDFGRSEKDTSASIDVTPARNCESSSKSDADKVLNLLNNLNADSGSIRAMLVQRLQSLKMMRSATKAENSTLGKLVDSNVK